MAPKSALLFFVVLSVLAMAVPKIAADIAATSRSPKLGGYQTIANLNTPMVVAVAKFAVAEHNKENKSSLEFVSVVKLEYQVVAGVNYRLVISAKDDATVAPKTYTAVVYKNLKGALSLMSFQRSIIAADTTAAPRSPKLGGYQTIANLNTPMVAAVAKFAVAEHNKENKSSLVFVSVVKLEYQVVAGVNYRIVISASDGVAASPKTYTAVVYKNLKGALLLVSFQ